MGRAGGWLVVDFPPFFSPFAIGIVLGSAGRRGERQEEGGGIKKKKKKSRSGLRFLFYFIFFSAQGKKKSHRMEGSELLQLE